MRLPIAACCAALALLAATCGSQAQTTTPGPRSNNADWVKCDARLTQEIKRADFKSQVRRSGLGHHPPVLALAADAALHCPAWARRPQALSQWQPCCMCVNYLN